MIEDVKCPVCKGPMVSRKNAGTGQRFWGCKAYPVCKGTRDTDGNTPAERNYLRDKDDSPQWKRRYD